MTFAIIDIVFLIIILVMAIKGAVNGFIAEVFGKAAFLVGLLVGVLFYNDLAVVLVQWISVVFLAQVVSFLLLFILTFLLIKVIQHVLGGIFKGDILGSLNRALGFFLGLAEGVLIVAMILLVLHVQPWIQVDSLLAGSFVDALFASPLNQSVEFVNREVMPNV
ncbi:MAG: CvpA family protein [Spirochaetaceae bacterium]|nr:CvpA family protein [Spirochaetaceae bacterium]